MEFHGWPFFHFAWFKIRLVSPDFFEDDPGPCEDFGDLFEADAVVPDVGHVGDDEGATCVEGDKCNEVVGPVLCDVFHVGFLVGYLTTVPARGPSMRVMRASSMGPQAAIPGPESQSLPFSEYQLYSHSITYWVPFQ